MSFVVPFMMSIQQGDNAQMQLSAQGLIVVASSGSACDDIDWQPDVVYWKKKRLSQLTRLLFAETYAQN
jgi:outer membrane protease